MEHLLIDWFVALIANLQLRIQISSQQHLSLNHGYRGSLTQKWNLSPKECLGNRNASFIGTTLCWSTSRYISTELVERVFQTAVRETYRVQSIPTCVPAPPTGILECHGVVI